MKTWNKKDYSPRIFAAILGICAFGLVFTSCPTPDGGNNIQSTGGGNNQPTGGDNNKTPTEADFNIGNLTQTADNVSAVTIVAKQGKAAGKITIYYEGTGDTTYTKSTTPPTAAGTYAVTFDVAAANGWQAAMGLSAGTLIINTPGSQTPTADDYNIGNLMQTFGSVTAVTIEPKEGKSPGTVTVKYNGSLTMPSAVGIYAVTFDVARADGWNAAIGISAGTLTINPKVITFTIDAIPAQPYTGNAIIPTITVKDGSTTLTLNTDYTVSYSNNINAGTATVSVTGTGNYAGITGSATFTIDEFNTYIITGSGTSFTATKSDITIGTANQPIQTVINGIRTHAAGKNSTIQFGDGTTVLDIGTASASFNSSGGTWGVVTLTGKITSNTSNTTTSTGTIIISNAVSVVSTADIANTSTITNNVNAAVYIISTGTVTISGGTVSATRYAVYNYHTGAITISGGTVSTTTGYAVFNYSSGAITISGGTVSATGTNGYAVYSSTGKITISGGTVSATTGYAVSSSNVTLDGSPSITGRIRLNAGQLTTASGFTPGTKTYTLEYASYAVGNIAVVGGSNFLSNFTLYNKTTWYLSASGNNLIMVAIILTIDAIPAQPYTGNAITPTITVKDGSTTLTLNTDYTVSYSNNTNAGTATVSVTGMGNYAGSTGSATFTINPKVITFTVYAIPAQPYTGNAITPTLTVKEGVGYDYVFPPLTLNTDYTVSYSNNINAGTATVNVTGMGNYAGSTGSAIFSIFLIFTIDAIPAQPYTGNAITPTLTVKDGSTILTLNTHYTVSYSNNTNAGTATVFVTGMGNYAGLAKSTTFTINPKVITFAIDTIPNYLKTGSAITPTVTVKDGSTILTLNTHYTVSYSNNTNAGTATVSVTGTGNYASSTGSATFTIDESNIYYITGSGTSFTARRNLEIIGTANQPIQTVINGIRTHAAGKNSTIQFGDGTTVLDIGTASASFNNSGGTWGAITLTGKITSNITTSTGTIIISNAVSAVSTADIANTSTRTDGPGVTNAAVYIDSTGTITISGGTVSATTYTAVYSTSTGTINISGGTVSAGNSNAVYSTSTGTINISGGTVSATTCSAVCKLSTSKITVSGTAKVTSAAPYGGTIMLSDGYTSSTTRLEITGGTVENTSVSDFNLEDPEYGGYAIFNESRGGVIISGGTISATNGSIYNYYTGKITVSGTAKITSANTSSYRGTIYLANGEVSSNTRLEIIGGTVENTAAGGTTVYNASNGGVIISGGTVSATSGISIYNNSSGKITVSGTAKITSANTTATSGTIYLTNSNDETYTYFYLLLEITGGTVENTSTGNGCAIYNNSAGKITVSGTAKVTSANTSSGQGTIYLADSRSNTAVRLEITGGTVENTATGSGCAIYHDTSGTVNISGGTVSKAGTGGYAVYSTRTGKVTITSPAVINGQRYNC